MVLPVPADMVRVRLRASLQNVGGQELDEAQFGFHLHREHSVGNPTDWPSDVGDLANGIRDRWTEHCAELVQWFGKGVVMDSVTVDHLNQADGKVLDQAVALFNGDDAWKGTQNASLPWECALVVSLYGYVPGSFTQHKQRKRGRMYLPPLATGNVTNERGTVAGATLDDLNAKLGDFFNDVQGMHVGTDPIDTDHFSLVIMSKGTPTQPLPPTYTQVVRIQLDNKVDSQRRRERQEPADYVVHTDIDNSN